MVLIVEDNPDMRVYIRQRLESNYQVIEAPDGREGYARAQECVPDLIITDVMMPQVDGYELTRLLRQDQLTSHIPIIMVNAKAADEDKFTGLETGVDAYLIKPFNKKELQIRVRKLIEIRNQLRQQTGTRAILTPSEVEVSSMDQQFLQDVKNFIEKNIDNEDFSVDDLASHTYIGKRQLQRKLKALTDMSPNQCIRTMRLHRAKQLLEQGAGTVSQITFEVGYSDFGSFSRAFKEEYGMSPSAVKPKK